MATDVPRISLVTLGVRDVEASAAFYERLGARRSGVSVAGVVAFFQLGATVLSLFDRDAMARETGLAADAGPGMAALAHNVADREAVDRTMAAAEAAGARTAQAAADRDWGGYSGYFADPDGHLWEIAWNPHFPVDVYGVVSLPD